MFFGSLWWPARNQHACKCFQFASAIQVKMWSIMRNSNLYITCLNLHKLYLKKHVRYSERLPMLNWWYGLHSKAHVPPRRWKLNDGTSNAFYFDFNQHVQKLLDKETTKCLFQKWFPIFIIALTLAGVRPSRRHFSMRCQKRIRASYMRLSEEQVHENVPHTTHSNWFVYNNHFSYTLPIYILLVSSLISTEVHVDHHCVSGPPFCGSSSILEVRMVHWSWHLSDHLRVLSECINMSKRVWRGN